MREISEVIGAIVLFCFVLFLGCCLLAVPTWLLWNWLVPIITNEALTEITLLQAFGLNILCNILFKSHQTCNQK